MDVPDVEVSAEDAAKLDELEKKEEAPKENGAEAKKTKELPKPKPTKEEREKAKAERREAQQKAEAERRQELEKRLSICCLWGPMVTN